MLISIIIATLNAESCIDRLIESIINQKYDDIEIIIIDGNSKDNTLEFLKKYTQNIDFLLSETDKGIYDAWNKGIKVSKGDWIMFLGADDVLMYNTLDIYKRHIDQISIGKEPDLISSKRMMVNRSGKVIREVGGKWIWPQCLKSMMISHPGALHNKTLFTRYGDYDVTYKIAGDYEFLLRANSTLSTDFINSVTVLVSEGGISDSILAIKEHYRAVVHHYPFYKFFFLLNDIFIGMKFYLKKAFRIIGLNVHLK